MRYNTGMSESSPPSTETTEPAQNATPASAATPSDAPKPHIPKKPTQGRVFRRTGYARAIAEGVVIFAAFRLLDMVSINTWPGAALIAFFFLLLLLQFSPPVWAASRVVSTKREKMSGRFWKMGPILAGFCFLVDLAVTLTLGNAGLFGGPDGNGPVWSRLAAGAAHPLSWGAFIGNEIGEAAFLLIYFTIAVICTRLANGGFMRFTMPAGNGRVTL